MRKHTEQATTAPARPAPPETGVPPFDTSHLDELLNAAGIDVAVITSKHNLQYLLGGYRYFFHDYTDAMGISRYLPILIYPAGRAEDAVYIAHRMESYEKDLGRFWLPAVETVSWGTLDAVESAVDHLKKLGVDGKVLGVERSFLPVDAFDALSSALPKTRFVEALFPFERLRARKTPAELELIRLASDGVVDAMLAVFASHGSGATKYQLVDALRREEIARGVTFEYCLTAAGSSLNRAPSDQVWRVGEVLSLDSGGHYRGYIGDLCRMGILGTPDSQLEDLLAEVESVQQAARVPIRAGVRGGDIFAAPEDILRKSEHRACTHFLAHGMGLIGHEAPRLTSRAPQAYPGFDADLPLETGMVISIETTIEHPQRGLIKLEDTLSVTDDGWQAYGDHGRGWNRGMNA